MGILLLHGKVNCILSRFIPKCSSNYIIAEQDLIIVGEDFPFSIYISLFSYLLVI